MAYCLRTLFKFNVVVLIVVLASHKKKFDVDVHKNFTTKM